MDWGLIWQILIGGVAGYLASLLSKGQSSGIIFNVIFGIVGGFIGGRLFNMLDIDVSDLWYGPLLAAVVGAFVMIWIYTFIKGVSGNSPK